MFLGECGTWGGASVDSVFLGSRLHVDGVLNWADCMTDGTTCAIFFDDSWEGVISIELDGLVA